MTAFASIRARAEARKGGPEALERLLPPRPSPGELVRLADQRVLAEMARRVFCSGFAWSVIEAKWPGFEAAFLDFDPRRLSVQADEFWEGLLTDVRIVRNAAKIMSVRHNAVFVRETSETHGSFGAMLADWPPSDQVGLLQLLSRRGSRLGGNTGQMLLRFLGYDCFVLSKDVVACLRAAGLDVADTVASQRDLARVQAQFNAWAEETGLPYAQLSRICALSIGENHGTVELARIGATGG